MKNNVVYRAGDTVRVISPEVFVRCGYPWDVQYVLDHVLKPPQRKKISLFLLEMHIRDGSQAHKEIYRAVGYDLLKKSNFGGNSRAIYTQRNDELKDVVCTVVTKKMVKTGEHQCGRYYEDGYGEEYEPPQLLKEQTHVILLLLPLSVGNLASFWIEQKHVEKVTGAWTIPAPV